MTKQIMVGSVPVGGGAPISSQQLLFQGAAVDADADGDPPLPAGLRPRPGAGLPAGGAGGG